MLLTATTLRGTPLYEAGIDAGDRINEIDGSKFSKIETFNAWLGKKKPGDRVKAKVTTAVGDREIEFALRADPRLEVVTFEQSGRELSAEQSSFRRSWLASKAKTAARGSGATVQMPSRPSLRVRDLPVRRENAGSDASRPDIGIRPAFVAIMHWVSPELEVLHQHEIAT